MHSSGFFRIKPIARLILKREISGSHMISDQSLLLSTIVLNDTLDHLKWHQCMEPISKLIYIALLYTSSVACVTPACMGSG